MTVEPDSLTRLKNKILIVDHPLLFKDIKTPPGTNQISMSFIMEAKDCESAYHVIVNPETPAFDIFLDISMPSYEKGIYSGEDLGKLILEYMPNCKIILLLYVY
jgi:hypothetical protein